MCVHRGGRSLFQRVQRDEKMAWAALDWSERRRRVLLSLTVDESPANLRLESVHVHINAIHACKRKHHSSLSGNSPILLWQCTWASHPSSSTGGTPLSNASSTTSRTRFPSFLRAFGFSDTRTAGKGLGFYHRDPPSCRESIDDFFKFQVKSRFER